MVKLSKPILPAGGIVVSEKVAFTENETNSKTETATTMKVETMPNSNLSNRWWKNKRMEKSSQMIYRHLRNDRSLNSVWEKRKEEKRKMQEAKDHENELKERARLRRAEDKARLAAKLKRKAENELKSSKYQVIKNPEKLKKMNKKQLRMIHKTQMGPDGVMRFAPLYSS